MVTILITGGSGLIGSALSVELAGEGHTVRHLTRASSRSGPFRSFHWDLDAGTVDPEALVGVDHIIHLAGASISQKRWNGPRIQELIESRTRGPELLYGACERSGHWPKSFVSAAGIGYYGATTSAQVYAESDPPGTDTIARISVAWEEAVDRWSEHTRVVKLRTPVVLAKDAGALAPLGKLARWGLASPIGSGRQFMPWIHLTDLVNAYRIALVDVRLHGAFNVVAPDQPDNRRFMRTLAKALHRPFILPAVPAVVLRMVVGEMATLLLNGSRINGDKLLNAGYAVKHPDLGRALEDLYR